MPLRAFDGNFEIILWRFYRDTYTDRFELILITNATSYTGVYENVDLPVRAFLPRDARHKRGICHHAVSCPSVCPFVTFVNSVKTNKRIVNILFTIGSPHHASFFSTPNVMAIFWRGLRGTNRDSRRIAGYRPITGGVRTTATVHRAVYRTDRHSSVNLYLSQPAWTTTTKRTEHNLSVRSGKSEAEATNNICAHIIEANYCQTRRIARPHYDSRATCIV